MMNEITRTDKEINDILNWAAEGRDEGSHYPGMSYEDGLIAMFTWLVGETDDRPNE